MPSYISHAIMGEQLYNEALSQNVITKIPISKEEIKGYSLGADLAFLSPKLKNDPQNYRTRDFFINMINYIKENNLIENSHTISLLYGHIAHYFLDINTHPLIYYIESGCQKTSLIPNHELVEGYIDSYLTQKILGKDIMDIKANYFNQPNLSNIDASNLLNSIYGEIYGDYSIIQTYKRVLYIFSKLEELIKSGLFPKEQLINISRFNQFLQKNNLTTSEILNNNNDRFHNPVTGQICNQSFMELYNQSIEMALEAIKIVNNYLYGIGTISELETVFKNISYDTGVECSLGKRMIYTRKKVNRHNVFANQIKV